MDKETKLKLLLLEQDYLVDSITKLKEADDLASQLDETDDDELIYSYLKKIDELIDQAEKCQNIAIDIEKLLKKEPVKKDKDCYMNEVAESN